MKSEVVMHLGYFTF